MDNLVGDAQFGEVSAYICSDLGLDGVEITILFCWVGLEIGFVVPAFRCRAVCQAQDAIFGSQFILDDIGPDSDDGCDVFE
jgi:hypothetical protein